MNPELILTADGSHTLRLPGLDETYHSHFGALAESMHIFIQSGLRALSEDINPVRLLEIGFGTGLNALLTLQQTLNTGRIVKYDAVEPFPLDETIYSQLNYPSLDGMKTAGEFFICLHTAAFSSETEIVKGFTLKKLAEKIEDINLPERFYHLVYFDAFAPAVQPELWGAVIFSKIGDAMLTGGILVTYSCKGDVKRALKTSGFRIEKLPGPAGKREFIRAVKI